MLSVTAEKVREMLDILLNWLDRHGLASFDYADALSSPLIRWLTARSWFAQRVAIQMVKTMPANIRPLLGIRPYLSSQTLALLCSARSWQYFGGYEGVTEQGIKEAGTALIVDRLPASDDLLWGLKLYFSTRFIQATPSTPNLFQTCNAVHALLDAYQMTKYDYFAQVASDSAEACIRRLGILESEDDWYCRYYPGMDTPVYNVNALFGAACHRLYSLGIGDVESNRRRADKFLRFVLSGQQADGSWPYAKDARGKWADGYHSGYILEALGYFLNSPLKALVGDAARRGIVFFQSSLIDDDGCPKYYHNRRYPIDVQNCAQAIQTVARLLPYFDNGSELLSRIVGFVRAALFVREDPSSGYFMASRRPWCANKIAYVRWGQAPMLLALTHAWNALRVVDTYFDLLETS